MSDLIVGGLISITTLIISESFGLFRQRRELSLKSAEIRHQRESTYITRALEAYELIYGLLQSSIDQKKLDVKLYETVAAKFVYLPDSTRTEVVSALSLIEQKKTALSPEEIESLKQMRLRYISEVNGFRGVSE